MGQTKLIMKKRKYIILCVLMEVVIYAAIFALVYPSDYSTYPFSYFWSDYNSQIIIISILYIVIYTLLSYMAYIAYKWFKVKYPIWRQRYVKEAELKQQEQEDKNKRNEWLRGTGVLWLQWIWHIILIFSCLSLFPALCFVVSGNWQIGLYILIGGTSGLIWVPVLQGFITIIKAAKLYIDKHK